MACKKRTKQRVVLAVLIVCSVCTMVYCIGNILAKNREWRESQAYYDAIRTQVYGGAKGKEPLRIDAVSAVLPGAVAWISAPDTPIDYPVMQGTDNSYYLRHRPDGTWQLFGSIFLDYRSASDFSDRQSVVYGHNMHYGDEMFTSLMSYRQQAYYDEHPAVFLMVGEKQYRLELFSGYVTQESEADVIWSGNMEYTLFLEGLRQKSLFESTVKVTEQDRIVTLCTCARAGSPERFVLHGKLADPDVG